MDHLITSLTVSFLKGNVSYQQQQMSTFSVPLSQKTYEHHVTEGKCQQHCIKKQAIIAV